MSKLTSTALVALLAASCLSSCGQKAGEPASNNAENQAAAAPSNPDACDTQGIKVGDKNIEFRLGDTDFRWNTAGDFVTLTEKGDGKDIELVKSTIPEGPSPDNKDCLKSGNYIRMASLRHAEPSRYLQALQTDGVDPGANPDPNHVTIGNYPDPNNNPTNPKHIDAIFVMVKAPGVTTNSPGDIIRRHDVVIIRGVSHDPWLTAPETPTEGVAVGLIDSEHQAQAAKWKIMRKGPGED